MRLRWYNPSLGDFEWRELPEDDEGALSLLDGASRSRSHVAVYVEWRDLGASVATSLVRAGEAARRADEELRES